MNDDYVKKKIGGLFRYKDFRYYINRLRIRNTVWALLQRLCLFRFPLNGFFGVEIQTY